MGLITGSYTVDLFRSQQKVVQENCIGHSLFQYQEMPTAYVFNDIHHAKYHTKRSGYRVNRFRCISISRKAYRYDYNNLFC